MKSITKSDLETFQEAIYKDYGIKLEGKQLYEAAYDLLHLFDALIKFDAEDKQVLKSSR